MSALGKPFYVYRFVSRKLPLKFAVAALFLASATLVVGQILQPLCSFNYTTGAYPGAALTLGNDGNFYGTTAYGGITNATYTQGMGTIFQVTTNGTLTTLVSFSGNTPYADVQGAYASGLILGNDGNFYGTTYEGGVYGEGSIFKVTTNGTLTTLVSFSGADASKAYAVFPRAALTLGNDGNFYGTTMFGGVYGESEGTIFKMIPNVAFFILASFDGTNGAEPELALTQGTDGNFYGTTPYGLSANDGEIFEVTMYGGLTPLVRPFYGAYSSALTVGNDGSFYGTTEGGGIDGQGTVFQVTTNGTLTTIASFLYADGATPNGLTLGNDGNFYGTTRYGGLFNDGTIFQVATNGILSTLLSFSGTNGANPESAPTLGNDGNFYGSTAYGGSAGCGTVFRLLMAPTFSVQPQSQTNNAGATVTFTCDTFLQPVGLQWQKNGTNLTDSGKISGATNSTLTIADISDSDAANYSIISSNAKGSVSSSNATLTVIDPPGLSAQPTNLIVLAGANATFGVTISGTPPFIYQWLFNSTNPLYGWSGIYTIPRVETYNAGNYSVVVSNSAGSVTSFLAALTVVLPPPSQTAHASSTATFTVTAVGPESLTYQWLKNGAKLANGANISGATNSTLTIASLSDADAAIYSAVVSDAYSGVTTPGATLTVNDSLFFAVQPLSQTLVEGSTVTFTATVYGAPPFLFQWFFNGNAVGPPVAGTNVFSLTLTNVATTQAGDYTVKVFNGSGSLMSSNAMLTVVPQPTLALQIFADYPLLTLNGILSNNFVVQYSSNLAETNWINLLSLTNVSTSSYQFLDPSGVGEPERFYRAFFTQ
jgi:uncharacterized repeat protein (TIGR03803 family)